MSISKENLKFSRNITSSNSRLNILRISSSNSRSYWGREALWRSQVEKSCASAFTLQTQALWARSLSTSRTVVVLLLLVLFRCCRRCRKTRQKFAVDIWVGFADISCVGFGPRTGFWQFWRRKKRKGCTGCVPEEHVKKIHLCFGSSGISNLIKL